MDERQVLELMRDVLFGSVSMGRQDLLYEIHRRLAALPAAAQETPDPTRCVVCGWTLAESREQVCVAGDCSYRPAQGTPEHDRIKDRLRAQMSAPAAAQADGEEPTMEECKIAYLSAWERSRGPHARAMFWNRDEQAGLEAVRSLCMERAPAPSHALVEAVSSVLEHDCPVCFDQDPASQAAMKRWINLGNKYRAARSSLPAAKKEGA